MPRTLQCLLLVFGVALSVAAAQDTPPPQDMEKQPPEELRVNGEIVGKRVPSLPGEVCALCNHPIGPYDGTYLVDGQRIPLHTQLLGDADHRHLAPFLAQLKPRGAFLGVADKAALSNVWFYVGLYILSGLLFGALAAHRALNTGHKPWSWFAVGFFFTVPGYIYLCFQPQGQITVLEGVPPGLGKISSTYQPQECPKCGTLNHPTAPRCSGCSSPLEPHAVSEVQRVGL